MKIISQRGEVEQYLVEINKDKAFIIDVVDNQIYAPMNIFSILARGYWEDYDGSQVLLNKWEKQIIEILEVEKAIEERTLVEEDIEIFEEERTLAEDFVEIREDIPIREFDEDKPFYKELEDVLWNAFTKARNKITYNGIGAIVQKLHNRSLVFRQSLQYRQDTLSEADLKLLQKWLQDTDWADIEPDQKATLGAFKAAYEDGLKEGAEAVQSELFALKKVKSPAVSMGFNLANPVALKTLEDRALLMVKNIQDGTRYFMLQEFKKNFTEGGSLQSIVKGIYDGLNDEEQGAFSRKRVASIARTELNYAHSSARVHQFEEVGLKTKLWDAVDSIACAICLANQAKGYVPIDYSGYGSVFGGGIGFPPSHPKICHCVMRLNKDELRDFDGEPVYDTGTEANEFLDLTSVSKEDLEDNSRLAGEMHGKMDYAVENKIRVQNALAKELEGDIDFEELVDYFEDVTGGSVNTLQGTISHLISSWARTSGDADNLAVYMQYVAEKEFGLKNVFPMKATMLRRGVKVYGKYEKGFRAFLRAQYNLTQKELAERGIDEIILFRGMSFNEKIKDLSFNKTLEQATDFDMQALSSFSLSMRTAMLFAHYENNLIMAVKIKRQNIFSTFLTGFGCSNEQEFVLLNTKGKALFYSTDTGMSIGDPKILDLFAKGVK